MKIAVAGIIACLASSVSAFVAVVPQPRASLSPLSATKPTAAASKEEDLELTRQVIAQFAGTDGGAPESPPKKEETAAAGASNEE